MDIKTKLILVVILGLILLLLIGACVYIGHLFIDKLDEIITYYKPKKRIYTISEIAEPLAIQMEPLLVLHIVKSNPGITCYEINKKMSDYQMDTVDIYSIIDKLTDAGLLVREPQKAHIKFVYIAAFGEQVLTAESYMISRFHEILHHEIKVNDLIINKKIQDAFSKLNETGSEPLKTQNQTGGDVMCEPFRRKNIIGEHIARLRTDLKISQTELASRATELGINMNQIKISNIETGLQRVTDIEAWVFAKALGVSVTELYDSDGESTSNRVQNKEDNNDVIRDIFSLIYNKPAWNGINYLQCMLEKAWNDKNRDWATYKQYIAEINPSKTELSITTEMKKGINHMWRYGNSDVLKRLFGYAPPQSDPPSWLMFMRTVLSMLFYCEKIDMDIIKLLKDNPERHENADKNMIAGYVLMILKKLDIPDMALDKAAPVIDDIIQNNGYQEALITYMKHKSDLFMSVSIVDIEIPPELYGMGICELPFEDSVMNTKISNAFCRVGIWRLRYLRYTSREDIFEMRNVGDKLYECFISALKKAVNGCFMFDKTRYNSV